MGAACALATNASRRWRRCAGRRRADQFAAALGRTADELRRRMQLKTLLFGMGETFRVLTQRQGRRKREKRRRMPEK